MTYGIRLKNADGKDVLNGRQTLSRVVYRIAISRNFSGTKGPYDDFDENRGAISITPNSFRYDVGASGNPRVGEGAGLNGQFVWGVNPFSVPDLVWDNNTKILTVTPAQDYNNSHKSDWLVHMIHYK